MDHPPLTFEGESVQESTKRVEGWNALVLELSSEKFETDNFTFLSIADLNLRAFVSGK
jgi:hypothetical protein